jgi:hypothetical protein
MRKKSPEVNKYEQNRILVLLNELLPRLSPALAAEIGLVASVLFLQIEFLIAVSDNVRNGRRWTYQSIRDFKSMFPFWSHETINRGIKSLQAMGLIDVQNFNRHKYDRTRWFAINEANAAKLKSIRVLGSSRFESQSSQFETGSSLDKTTIPNTTSNTSTDNSTKSTTKEKQTLSALPSASSLVDTQTSIDNGLAKPTASEPPGNSSNASTTMRNLDDAALEVFKDWRDVMEYPDAIFNAKTRTSVIARLKEGYSVENLKLAIRGILFSKFHMGENDKSMIYDRLSTICRDGDQVEGFKNLSLAARIKPTDPLRKHEHAKGNAINGLSRKELHYAITRRDDNGIAIREEPYVVDVGGRVPKRDFTRETI